MGFTSKVIVSVIVIGLLGFFIQSLFNQNKVVPQLDEVWWGPNENKEIVDKNIRPFSVNISDTDLKDLQYRLAHHRPLTPSLEGIQQQYGFNSKLLQEIIHFWRHQYNWRKCEKLLNKYPQFITNIQGLDIHFIRVKPEESKGVKVLPLLLLHGWPESVKNLLSLIDILTKPRNGIVFEVVAPHLPGFGFSQAAVRPGLGGPQMAVVLKNLMLKLGFNKFYGQGGDFGAYILKSMSVLYPEVLAGLHSNMCTVYTPKSYLYTFLGLLYPQWIVKKEHEDRVYPLKKLFEERMIETGYFHLQSTKPDSLGFGLNDSPVGLAAYILEKYSTLTNFTNKSLINGGLKDCYSYEDLLDNIMIYWWTGSITTSMRIYAETFNKINFKLGIVSFPTKIPSACARFKYDIYAPDGLLGEVFPNLVQLTDYDGGHFASFQMPDVLAKDVFMAVEKFEEIFRRNSIKTV
ncbi:unnamed protein product [Brassicogethes aeneus]|uniref:Epoxide hydrolase n=1 Tax=Brassicogethes aeneus TaxID=1431903 RepID=A0A9P0ATF3_BRAAE|nr:unnamed protein product [Brassicogethes aeneus]